MTQDRGEILLYQAEDGHTALEVRLEQESVWLSLNQLAELFQRDKSVISRHLSTIYASGELDRQATVAKNATVQMEGSRKVTRQVEVFNLDAIISVGYRINSKRSTQFRIWATKVLRDHLIKGYTLHERRLMDKGIDDLTSAALCKKCILLIFFQVRLHFQSRRTEETDDLVG